MGSVSFKLNNNNSSQKNNSRLSVKLYELPFYKNNDYYLGSVKWMIGNLPYLGNLKDELVEDFYSRAESYIDQNFPEVKNLDQKLKKRLVDYSVKQVGSGKWENISPKNKDLCNLVESYKEIKNLSDFKLGEKHTDGTEESRGRPIKTFATDEKTGEQWIITEKHFSDNEIRSYLGNLYQPFCNVKEGNEEIKCAPDMRIIYDAKEDKFLLGSRFLDKGFKTIHEYRVNELNDTEVKYNRQVTYNHLLGKQNSKDENSYAVLASLLFLTEADPHLGNIMIKKDKNKHYLGKIDHDGSFMNLYSKQWIDLVDVVFRDYAFKKDSLDLNKLVAELEKIENLSDEKIIEQVDKHVHFLKSLGLDQWNNTNLKLPVIPDFGWDLARIVTDLPKQPKELGKLLLERKKLLKEMTSRLHIESCLQNDDIERFKQLEKESGISKTADFWFYNTKEKSTLLCAAAHYNASNVIKYIGGSRQEVINAASIAIKEKKVESFSAFLSLVDEEADKVTLLRQCILKDWRDGYKELTQNSEFHKQKKYQFALLNTYCDSSCPAKDDLFKNELRQLFVGFAKAEFSQDKDETKLDLDRVIQFLESHKGAHYRGLVRLIDILEEAFPQELDSKKSYEFTIKLFALWYEKEIHPREPEWTNLWTNDFFGLTSLVAKITDQSDLQELALVVAKYMKAPRSGSSHVRESFGWMEDMVDRIEDKAFIEEKLLPELQYDYDQRSFYQYVKELVEKNKK